MSAQRARAYLRAIGKRLLLADGWLVFKASVLLPPRVAWFYVRAHVQARRSRDAFSLLVAARPEDLSRLLRLAKGRRYVVELGTGTGWTAIALAIADRQRRVVSYDPIPHAEIEWYVDLAGAEAKGRIDLRPEPAERGPAPGDPPVEFLFIDIGGHSRASTAAAFLAWRDSLAPGAVVAFHDYGPAFPGVPMAVAQLGLEGRVTGRSVFVWRS